MRGKRFVLLVCILASLIFGLASSAFGEDLDILVSSVSLKMGTNYPLSYAVTPSSAAEKMHWTSSDTSVVKVNDNGVITAVKGGTATISATSGSFSKDITVSVGAVAAKSMKLSRTSAAVAPLRSFVLSVKITPANTTYSVIDWVSSDPTVATVTDNGTVLAHSIGTARITASLQGTSLSATCLVKVSDIPVSSVKLKKTALTLTCGKVQKLTVTVSPATASDTSLTWSSSNPAVATVDSDGVVTTLTAGKTIITAKANDASGKKASCTITVAPVAVKSVTLNKTYASVDSGDTVQLTATVLPAEASQSVSYSSSNTSAATVSSEGKVTAVAPGASIITAKAGSVEAKMRIVVRTNKSTKSLVITAAGDITIGGDPRGITETGYNFILQCHSGNYSTFLKNVASYFKNDDLTIVNLESVLTTATAHANKTYVLKAPPAYVAILSTSGVDACNLANNHSADFGAQGLSDTRKTLSNAGIASFGGTSTKIMTINGIKVGLCGFHTGSTSKSAALKVVKQLRPQCDVLIVSAHWGVEFVYSVSSAQRSFGRALVDAGADLVLGHHSHVVSGIEVYKGKYIVYGLGTLSSCIANPTDKDTILFRQKFLVTQDGDVQDGGAKILPCSMSSRTDLNNAQPIVLSGSDAQRVYDKVKKYSSQFPYQIQLD